tara:strand:- start:3320 stop:3616 length:297 start_codon:yes stop_codon:yes gene_type:complete
VFKENITKFHLIKELKRKTGFSSNFTKKIINELLEILIKEIINGNLNLKNIGTFKIIHKNQRIGRNPKTNEEFIITPRKVISFTPSKKLSDKMRDLNG